MPHELALRVAQRFASQAIKIRSSPIHGQGAFAVYALAKGTWLKDNLPASAYRAVKPGEPGWDGSSAIVRPDGKLLIHGGPYGSSWQDYLNHSDAPNAAFVPLGSMMILTTTKNIPPGREITINYHRAVHPADPDLKEIEPKSV